MRARWVFGLLLLLACGAPAQQLKIVNFERKINLKSQYAKVTDVIEVASTGGESSAILLCWPTSLAERLSRIRVTVDKERREVAPAAEAPPGDAGAGASCWSAAVRVPKGDTLLVDVSAAFTGVMRPNPAKIGQDERQLVEYEDSLWAASPYSIKKQTTTILLPTRDIISVTPEDKATKSDTQITFNLGSADPWSKEQLKVHFHHDKPFKKVAKLLREIQMSHWGNIYVEETYVIINAGAEHKGPFSRLKHSYSQGGPSHVFQNIKAHLPPAAHSLYYNDLIGNISSSHTRKSMKETLVDINLRYPLMGGWKTDFTLGYSLPLEGFLYRRPKGRNRLIVDISAPIDDVVVEELETRVVLPEGSGNIEYTLPFDLDVSWDKKFTYLDTRGRPVLVLRKSNLTPQHNRPFAVDYTFGATALMREPLLLIAVFATFFAAAMVYQRLEFTISKDAKWLDARAKEKAAAVLQQLAVVWDEEYEELQRLSATTDALADTVGIEAAQSARHAGEARFKALDAKAKLLLNDLAVASTKAAATARDHADKGKALQQRAVRMVADKADLLRKGTGAADAARRLAPTTKALRDAMAEWEATTFDMCT